MKRQNVLSLDAGGTCVTVVPQPKQRVKVDARARVRPAGVPKQPVEDFAPWVMRFLALALVLFVLVLFVLYG